MLRTRIAALFGLLAIAALATAPPSANASPPGKETTTAGAPPAYAPMTLTVQAEAMPVFAFDLQAPSVNDALVVRAGTVRHTILAPSAHGIAGITVSSAITNVNARRSWRHQRPAGHAQLSNFSNALNALRPSNPTALPAPAAVFDFRQPTAVLPDASPNQRMRTTAAPSAPIVGHTAFPFGL